MRGLLEGVAPPPPEVDPNWTPPERLEVGEVMEDFTLPDMAGTLTALTSLLDRQLLLVNWSPGCGFCLKIADELGGLQQPLDDRGIRLAFVTSGDADANRPIFDGAGLSTPALLKQEGVDPFAGFGTPAAYLLDTDGKVTAPMAYGANEVPVLVRELAGVDPSEPVDDHAGHEHEEGDAPTVRYLPAASAVCGPGGGGGHAKSTEWLGTRAYALGNVNVGIRYNSEATAEVLDRLFPGLQVDDPNAPDNFSVALYPPASGKSRELNLLVQGSQQLVRSRSAARVLRALLTYLSASITLPDPSLMQISATAAIRDGQALLLPAGILGWLKVLQPRCRQAGIQLVDAPMATVDPGSNELVVLEPTVEHDASVLANVDEGARLGSELPAVLPGRYPLRSWYLTVSEDALGTLPPALGFASAVGSVALGGENGSFEEAVNQVLDLTRRIDTRGVWYESAEELVRQVAESK
jgi:thiol-disulfide isomerase/thioredoxin